MINTELKNKILGLLPDALGQDIKDNIEAVIQSYLEKMNLVSRKEFEVQQKVLAKTREKLDSLQTTLDHIQEAIEDDSA